LGLIYSVDVRTLQTPDGPRDKIHIVMTLTTPGCPLAGVFDTMVKDSLEGLPGIDLARDVMVELTFDPPWVPDMMSEEARAELGL
jgi:metal-sulfur cluster biosynthetic enzyme